MGWSTSFFFIAFRVHNCSDCLHRLVSSHVTSLFLSSLLFLSSQPGSSHTALHEGDDILTSTGELITIKRIEHAPQLMSASGSWFPPLSRAGDGVIVYTMCMDTGDLGEESRTFFAGGILAHNGMHICITMPNGERFTLYMEPTCE